MARNRRPTVARPRDGVTARPRTAASAMAVARTPVTPSVADTTSGRAAADAVASAAINSSSDRTIRRRVRRRRRRRPPPPPPQRPPRRAAYHGGRPRRRTDVRRRTRDNGDVRRPTYAATDTPVPRSARDRTTAPHAAATGARRLPRRRVRVSAVPSPERPAAATDTDRRRPTVTAETTRALRCAVRPTWCCWPTATGRFTCSWSSAVRLDTSSTITSRPSPLRSGTSCEYITDAHALATAGVQYLCRYAAVSAVFGVSWSINTIICFFHFLETFFV